VNIEARRVRLLVGLVAAGGLAFAICFGPTRLALGLSVRSAAHRPLAGSLDRSFGRQGVVTHSLGSNESRIGGIAVQRDGRIVAAASGTLGRYLPNGSLDSSFGHGGYVSTGISAVDAVALQRDGRIVVAGESGPVSDSVYAEFAVARYNPDGSVDASFGTDGIVMTVIPETIQCGGDSGANASALAILPGGDILAAGTVFIYDCYAPYLSGWALARYTPDGSLDPTFGDAGIVQTAFYGDDELSGIAVQRDGKTVAAGSGGLYGHGGTDIATMAIARYKLDGSLDAGFDGGTVTTDPHLYYYGGPTVVRHKKILVAGTTSKNGNKWLPVLARFLANGDPDWNFGNDGVVKIRRQLGAPSAMTAQQDGKILIAEYSDQQGPSAIVRLLPDGRLDRSFGRGGIVRLSARTSTLALQRDGKILAGGGASNTWTLARLIGGNNCIVPGLHGKTVSHAGASLTKSYCRRGRVSKRFSSTVVPGRVISTVPHRSARLPGGTQVELVVSKGSQASSPLATGGVPQRVSPSGLVFRYYPGSGWQFHPLISFVHLNNLILAGRTGAVQRLVKALLARSHRHGAALYWNFDFPYGGPVPWTSGFTQAVAAQALARAGRLLRQPALLKPARAALLDLRRGLLLHVGGGLWIREYGFNQDVILNSQLQSLLSLRNYAHLTGSPLAARLVKSLYRATVRLLPRFDLGCHSLYQLGGPVADQHYQDYQVGLLKRLAGLYPAEPIFRRLYLRWRPCA
jgi:uncharacterized delta-60 repeat protein